MSRIGKQPIELPAGVNVAISPGRVQVNGPLGELSQSVPARMQISQEDTTLVVKRPTERGDDRALHGLTRSLLSNMVEGVTKGFEKRLELQGVGYRAALRGTDLELNVGFSHPVVIKPPQGISFEVPEATSVLVKGIDKQQVGEIAAQVRKVRPPEPYKGKGIRYEGEYATAGFAASSSARPSGRAWSSSVRTAASRPSSSTMPTAKRWRRRAGCTLRRRPRATRRSRRPRSAGCWPRTPRRRTSKRSSSTAAATCTTDA
jgi:large subunit ribosomal protein L6